MGMIASVSPSWRGGSAIIGGPGSNLRASALRMMLPGCANLGFGGALSGGAAVSVDFARPASRSRLIFPMIALRVRPWPIAAAI